MQVMIDKKELENMEYFNSLCSMITSDIRCTREIQSRTTIAKSAFKKKKALFYQQIGLKFKEGTSEMQRLEHGFVW